MFSLFCVGLGLGFVALAISVFIAVGLAIFIEEIGGQY